MIKKISFIVFLLAFCCISCVRPIEGVDFRKEMRDFVIRISNKAKQQHPGFLVIPQNGIELIFDGEPANRQWATDYVNAIDGCSQEDLRYGYPTTECTTPTEVTTYWESYLQPLSSMKRVLAVDYCAEADHVADSYQKNHAAGFLSFAAPDRNLDRIPAGAPYNENNTDIHDLQSAKNFLYLINPQNYNSKESFISAIKSTNYDLVVVDLFFNEEMLTASDVAQLQQKTNGGKRLVVCYMSIGEAESYRYYWQKAWKLHRPEWLDRVNPDWAGNYKVHYWNPEWQEIICGDGDSYLNRILAAGFDGVYLDIIDAFEYYENR